MEPSQSLACASDSNNHHCNNENSNNNNNNNSSNNNNNIITTILAGGGIPCDSIGSSIRAFSTRLVPPFPLSLLP